MLPGEGAAQPQRRARPRRRGRFRIDRSTRLVEAVDRGAVDLAVYATEAAGTAGIPVGGLPPGWYAAPSWTPPDAPGPLPLVAIEDPCAIRRRAPGVLAERGIPATVVCDAGCPAGASTPRAGLGAALLASIGEAPGGLAQRHDLPPVPTIRMSAHVGKGTDPAMVAAMRGLLAGTAQVAQGAVR
ncbi:hypothetical protein ACIOEX_28015 [Streptomyces sp. NPDC087850]|uniref:hypothetical protein n=1 Tax=Streptomyces sp. NPDC087850 TaxID=3365809 RepID=UPI0037F607B4